MPNKYNLNLEKLILRNPFVFTCIQLLASFINISFLNWLSNKYSFEAIGLISFIFSFAGIPAALISQGFDQLILMHITSQKNTLSEIASLTISSRIVLTIPIIFITSFLFNLTTNNIFACLLISTEILKNIVPNELIDQMKITYIVTLASFLEKLSLFILVKYLLVNLNFNGILASYALIQIIYTVSLLIIFKRKLTNLKLQFNISRLKFEIFNSFKSIPNILSQLSFGNLVKLSLGLSGLYEYLGQFSIAWQLANVATLPISFDLRVNLNKITDLGSYLKNKNSRKGNYINKKIINSFFIRYITFGLISGLIFGFFLNMNSITDIFPKILKFQGLYSLALFIIIYLSFAKFGDALEKVIIGFQGRKLVLKSYLPGMFFSLIFNLIGIITKNKLFMIIGFSLGHFLTIAIMYAIVKNSINIRNLPHNKAKFKVN